MSDLVPVDIAASSSIHVDPDSGTVMIEGGGFWDDAFIRDTFAKLRIIIGQLRANGRQIRVIVDYRASTVQSVASFGGVQEGVSAIYREGDKVALIANSPLVKMQLKRVKRDCETRCFESIEEAKAWLHR